MRFHLLEMATTASSSLQIAAARPCLSSSRRLFKAGATILGGNSKAATWNKLTSGCHISSVQPFQRSFTSSSIKFSKVATKAMSNSSESKPVSGLPIDLRGQFSLFCFPSLFGPLFFFGIYVTPFMSFKGLVFTVFSLSFCIPVMDSL